MLTRTFFTRDVLTVAPSILGKYLVRQLQNGLILSGMIVEVEAYLGDDPASHAYKGMNSRNASLYKTGGHAYVHTQRHHTLVDVVVGKDNQPSSLLIRALIPEEGITIMQQHRQCMDITNLTNGPGKLCKALDISKTLDGIDLTKSDHGLWIEDRGIKVPERRIKRTPRVGIGKAKDLLLRYVFLPSSVD